MPEDLILALCREAGDGGADAALLAGWRSRPYGCCEEAIFLASAGDVQALMQCRHCCGLSLWT